MGGERFTRGQAIVDLKLRAAFKPHQVVRGNRLVTVATGDVLTSQAELARAWGWTRETVARFLALLRTLNLADIETSKATDSGYTIIRLKDFTRFPCGSSDTVDIEEDTVADIEHSASRIGETSGRHS